MSNRNHSLLCFTSEWLSHRYLLTFNTDRPQLYTLSSPDHFPTISRKSLYSESPILASIHTLCAMLHPQNYLYAHTSTCQLKSSLLTNTISCITKKYKYLYFLWRWIFLFCFLETFDTFPISSCATNTCPTHFKKYIYQNIHQPPPPPNILRHSRCAHVTCDTRSWLFLAHLPHVSHDPRATFYAISRRTSGIAWRRRGFRVLSLPKTLWRYTNIEFTKQTKRILPAFHIHIHKLSQNKTYANI